MSDSFDLDSPDHFTCGAVGLPGQRIFYLQVQQSHRLVTLKCEKEHVVALAEFLADLLRRLGPSGQEPPSDLALLEPISAAWVVNSIGVGYDKEDDRILVVAKERVDEESGEEPATARFRITRAQAAGFVECVQTLIKAGRPLCPMCSRPMDPAGHICPRSNGHTAR